MAAKKKEGRPARFDRETVLDKATELFALHGYSGTSLSELVHAIGCTPPSLYNYFASKSQLYLAVIDRYWSRANPDIPAEGRAWPLIEGYLLASMARFTRETGPRGCLVLTGGFRESEDDQELKQALQKIRQAAIDKLTGLIVRAKSEGDLAPEIDPPALSRGIFALLQGLALLAMDGATQAELIAALNCFLKNLRRPANYAV